MHENFYYITLFNHYILGEIRDTEDEMHLVNIADSK